MTGDAESIPNDYGKELPEMTNLNTLMMSVLYSSEYYYESLSREQEETQIVLRTDRCG